LTFDVSVNVSLESGYFCRCHAQHLVVKFGSFFKAKRRSLYDEGDDDDVDAADDDDDYEQPVSQSSLSASVSLFTSVYLSAIERAWSFMPRGLVSVFVCTTHDPSDVLRATFDAHLAAFFL